ncbi:MAG: TadE/TadG family type IV pilus assembly protein [Actinomycetota bacterium]
MRRFRRLKKSDRGANLVEFAMVMPFLLMLLIGIVEFSWTFATNLDVKQGAREAARITAVNEPDGGNAALAAEICDRMDLVGDDTATEITWLSDDGSPDVGEGVTLTVTTPHTTLTGFLDWAFGGITNLESTVEIRIEQDPDWSDDTQSCP